MNLLFYGASAVAIACAALTITRRRAMHALMYLILLFLAIALMLYTLGAHFAAALEVIIYAGAILVLFLFAVMLLGGGPRAEEREREWLRAPVWVVPILLGAVLLALTVAALSGGMGGGAAVPPMGGTLSTEPAGTLPGGTSVGAVSGGTPSGALSSEPPPEPDAGLPSAAGSGLAPAEVGAQLFSTYALGVELASILLLAGLLAAFHLGVFPRPGERSVTRDERAD